ncbi:HigB toxin protein [Fusibacter sp. 3D3]|nr:HigB toxin protein [Fusibacter sp. 3D3]
MAILIHQRLDQIRSASSVEMLVQFSIGRCHPLQGNRKGEYAMDLVQPYRMIFEQNDKEIQVVRIIKIEDYH